MSGWSIKLALALTVSPIFAQLPASGTLSDRDRPLFRAEIARIEALLRSAPDKAAVTYQLARTWASPKQWPETIEWLRKVAALRVGLDPGRDSVFADLQGTPEFDEIADAVRQATPPVSHSATAFAVPQGDQVPESMAYDAHGRSFYFGSMTKGEVLRCSTSGNCTQFATGLGIVFGIKVSHDGLWLLSNSANESSLVHFDLASARIVHAYSVQGARHTFNDLVIAPTGDIYLTDTRAQALWRLTKDAAHLTQLAGRFEAANGIALSADGSLLYVATFPDGITVVDLNSGLAKPIEPHGPLSRDHRRPLLLSRRVHRHSKRLHDAASRAPYPQP